MLIVDVHGGIGFGSRNPDWPRVLEFTDGLRLANIQHQLLE